MPFQVCFYHVIWATRNRESLITPEIERIVITTIQHKSHQLNSPIHAINTVEDHIHVAVSIAPRVSIADWVKQAKGISAHEVNAMYPDLLVRFGWQKGYGILTFGAKQLPNVEHYIQNQKHHHQTGQLEVYLERTQDDEG